VKLERGTPDHILQGLAARGHEITVPIGQGFFGRGQIIWRHNDGIYIAGSDPRADGMAVGW